MKKFRFLSIAIALAIGFSAFTPAKTNTQTVWFQDDGEGDWISEDLIPCEEGSDPVCEVFTNGYGLERIFHTPSTLFPYSKE
jgi:hypothetical protein